MTESTKTATDAQHDERQSAGSEHDQPHRPPKFVDGHYKPHFGDPDADWAIYTFWGGRVIELYTTDADGDAAGVVRRQDGTPAYEGGGHIAGHIYGDEVQLQEFWKERLDVEDVEQVLHTATDQEVSNE